jgi:general stress protein 26
MITQSQAKEQQAGIIRTKIMELQSALFFTESSSLLRLPTHVISNVSIDEEGQIWMAIPRPVQRIEEFEKKIPAKLDFFKKGTAFYVKVTGKAHLVNDINELKNNKALPAEMLAKVEKGKYMAVKVRIQDADLVDNTPPPKGGSQNWIRNSRMQLSSWFF